MNMRNVILVSLLTLPLCGCLVAGAAVGVAASGELIDSHAYSSHVDKNANVAWQTVKTFLSEQSKQLIEYDDQTRVATAKIDGSSVTVSVEAWDVDKCVMHVSAKKYLSTVNDGEMAKIIMERILRRV